MFDSERQAGRIPLILVNGESISDTRAFMNILLAHHAFADSVVMAIQRDEQGPLIQPLRFTRVVTLPRLESSAQDSCLCCGMHSALGDALRKLFFEALRDRSKRLGRVLIESDTIDTDQLTHTLRHTPFLGQRYVHQQTFRVRKPLEDAKVVFETLNIR